MASGKDTKAHTIRFPADIYAHIKAMSLDERRTFNNQVIRLLEIGIKSERQLLPDEEEEKWYE